MVERVRIGLLEPGRYGVIVSRAGIDVLADDAPLLETNLESQQVILSGVVPASIVPNVFGSEVFVPFGVDLGFVPIILFWPEATTENDNPPTHRYSTPFAWENSPYKTGTLFATFSVRPQSDGFTLRAASRNMIRGKFYPLRGYAVRYYVTKTSFV